MILRSVRPARPADDIELADITSAQRIGTAYWHPDELDTLVVPLDSEPSAAEAKAIRRRLVTTDAADEQHLADLLAGLADTSAPEWARLAIAAQVATYGDPADLA